MQNNIYLTIFIMAIVTYIIRVTPLILLRKQIKNRTIQSFLYYVPYVTLAVMTFPAILSATQSILSATLALIIAFVSAWSGRSLVQVAAAACIAVYLAELILF